MFKSKKTICIKLALIKGCTYSFMLLTSFEIIASILFVPICANIFTSFAIIRRL